MAVAVAGVRGAFGEAHEKTAVLITLQQSSQSTPRRGFAFMNFLDAPLQGMFLQKKIIDFRRTPGLICLPAFLNRFSTLTPVTSR